MQWLLVISFSSPTPVAVIPGIVYPLSFWLEEHWRWHRRFILVVRLVVADCTNTCRTVLHDHGRSEVDKGSGMAGRNEARRPGGSPDY